MSGNNNNGAWGMLGSVAGAGLGGMMNSWSNAQELEYNKATQNHGAKLQKGLMNDAHQLSLDKWNKTNVGAQVKHMEDAGMNVGLMYGGGGKGGETQVATPSAPSGQNPSRDMMGIGAKVGTDAALAGSQIELNKAQANKLNVDAKREDMGNEDHLEFGRRNKREGADKEYRELLGDYNRSQREAAGRNEKGYKGDGKSSEEKYAENKYERDNVDIYTMRRELINKGIEAKAMEEGINLSEERRNEIWHKIRQEWAKVGFKGLDGILKMYVTGKR